ncbi:hypothetical protein SAMN02745166_03427 [Prosthecobacter debontii]|uniref:CRISPR-associated protein (Cas_Cas02710) n=1 Tax=Prosthecobacter debontii TaxID=48467 RepID=A0A1T4YIP8_9BACT|nr:hypothetical protein [Prosthecobacter debontii]SKB01659.1 hypothetical protein SAMN02745166_03427 [Prosthecobacter debontii]
MSKPARSLSRLTFNRTKDRIISFWRRVHHRPGGYTVILLLTLAAFLVAVAGGLMESYVGDWLKQESTSHWIPLIAVGLLICSAAVASLAWIVRESISTFSERTFIAGAEPSQVLIFFVSYPKGLEAGVLSEGPVKVVGAPPRQTTAPSGSAHATAEEPKVSEVLLPRSDLMEDANRLLTLNAPFSWEMLLRGIHPHRRAGTLQRIYLLGSAPVKGSSTDPGTHVSLPDCKAFLQPYIPDIPIVEWPVACDFEMMDEVQRCLRAIIESDKEKHASHDSGICIDITGGQKTSSAAAVLTSVNRGVAIQYVQTQLPKEPHRYDISFTAGPDRLIQG